MTDGTLFLLVRNRVRNYAAWRAVFDANGPAAEAAGLHVESVWQEADDPGNVFFLFRVEDRARALAFMSTPEAAESGERSGVLDGEYHFIAPAG